jgi:hypothetical protein
LSSSYYEEMKSEPRPPWLIRQEHGTLAEARTRAILLDRFWILERSADIDGADLIIQRRLTHRSLLDRTPPRVGFIQAKFYADPTTTHYVHSEYVRSPEGRPRSEFFVICHSGIEDRAQSFLLSAEEISERFKLTSSEHSKPGRFVLPGRAVLTQRFQILDRGTVLDRIERALHDADFDTNRAFASWALPTFKNEAPPILAMYEEKIDNRWADIPTEFERIRERAKDASYQLEDAYRQLCDIQETRDPERALELAKQLKREWGKHIDLPEDLFDEGLLAAVDLHKKRYEQLDAAGLLGAHAALRRSVTERIVSDIAPQMPMTRDMVYVLTTRYDRQTFVNVVHESQFVKPGSLWPVPVEDEVFGGLRDMPGPVGVLDAKDEMVRAYLAPGRYSYQVPAEDLRWSRISNWEDIKMVDTPGTWAERTREVVQGMVLSVLEKVLTGRFGP